MNTFSELVKKSQDFTDSDKYYWFYMYDLGTEVIVPLLKSKKIFQPNDKVAEIGSAEGGVLAAFVEAGAEEALATDIAENRLKLGEKIVSLASLNIKYHYHDIINQEPKQEWNNKYDLVLLRDVIEHLDDTEIALSNIIKIIKKGGYLYVTFPPYKSPYGGHQHTVATRKAALPWIHLLPQSIFYKFIEGGRAADIEEVKRLTKIKLSPEKFELAARKAGFSVHKRSFYLLRPVFKMKFGLPTLAMGILSQLPFMRNYFATEAEYILKKND